MGPTHKAWAPVFTLLVLLLINSAAQLAAALTLINPLAAALAGVLSVIMASGMRSPDCDHKLWPGRPKPGYPLWSHRGITHRWWLGFIILALLGGLPMLLLDLLGVPSEYAVGVLGLPMGWLSHLAGDMWFGRLRVLGRSRGLAWETGGPREIPARKALTVVLPFLCLALLAQVLSPVAGLAVAAVGLLVGWVWLWLLIGKATRLGTKRPQGGSRRGSQGGSRGGSQGGFRRGS